MAKRTERGLLITEAKFWPKETEAKFNCCWVEGDAGVKRVDEGDGDEATELAPLLITDEIVGEKGLPLPLPFAACLKCGGTT